MFRPLHVGVAVRDMPAAIEFYRRAFGFTLRHGPVDDPIQQVTVCFLAATDGAEIELITPLGDKSPVARYLARETGAYHVCYEVPDIEAALQQAIANGCLPVSPPVPAAAFGGRRIAWLYTPTKQLIELLQST
jgi:methylmalonyl-CoA/ethylmalonyl-CoA epimerase